VIVKMIVEKQLECRLAGETEVLGENLPQRHSLLSITNSHMTRPGFEPGPPRWEEAITLTITRTDTTDEQTPEVGDPIIPHRFQISAYICVFCTF
jgi:hypothetical protein